MKDIFTILAENNVTVPEEAKSAITAAVGENYKTVAEVEKIQRARDNYKTQLETAQDALKGFEGVDVKELQGRIASLQGDLQKAQDDYQAKIADMEFESVLDAAVSASKAKNAKAVRALLDLDALKASKNQAALDISTHTPHAGCDRKILWIVAVVPQHEGTFFLPALISLFFREKKQVFAWFFRRTFRGFLHHRVFAVRE